MTEAEYSVWRHTDTAHVIHIQTCTKKRWRFEYWGCSIEFGELLATMWGVVLCTDKSQWGEDEPVLKALDFHLECQMCDDDEEPHQAWCFGIFSCGCTALMCKAAHFGIQRITKKMAFKCHQCGESCRLRSTVPIAVP